MPPPTALLDLVTRFEEQLEAYKSGSYNETQLRIDFLDPFFSLLGWDMHNASGHAEAYRDVIHEDEVRVGGALKAPDYGFRIGGTRKFFLEAKKPSVLIKEEISPAYQLRRYAWSAKLPLSILSDFEEFAVYDSRIKPKPNDKASTARVFYCTYKEYVEKWDEIAAIFSKEAILKGSFDKYASNKGRRGTAEVDEDFLLTIESWRRDLAHDLARRNAALSERDLNFAVQKIIDRIIFLRICEDRGMEDYGKLKALTAGPRIYPRLTELFRAADTRYNSGLFHFQPEKGREEGPDELTLELEVDDKLLRDLLKQLYYPDSPYEFRVLSADILGQVYEQFLGKVIRLTASHKAEVDDKPEVKKAGGVYYTPTYVVDYIVRETVGVLIEGKTPKQIATVRILDPACGSGSFLIGAYQFLLDWYLKYYISHDSETHAKGKRPVLIQTPGGWRLSIEERKRLLLAHIHGVDIDSQAVEVTKLSLLLKVLEGETNQSLQPLFQIFRERALPDLGNNIKCGNSLIGSDFYAQPDLPLLSDDEKLRINVFDWDGPRGFQQIMKEGGFDAVIGNPPYVRQESISPHKIYFQKHYEAFDGVADLYAYFMEKAVKLLRSRGRFSFIVSSSFLRATYGGSLRRMLKQQASVQRIVDFGGLAVFANAKDTYVCIPVFEKNKHSGTVKVTKIPSLEVYDVAAYAAMNSYEIPLDRLTDETWSLKSDKEDALFEKINSVGVPLGKYVAGKMFYGIKTGLNEAFVIDFGQRSEFIRQNPRNAELIKSFLGGQDIRRYYIEKEKSWIVIPCGWTTKAMALSNTPLEKDAWAWLASQYAAIANHLSRFSTALEKREDQGDFWWELRPCDYYGTLEKPKIIFPDICKNPRFYLDTKRHYLTNTAYCLGTDDRYLLGVLNSKLFWFSISHISIPFGVRAGKYRYRLIYQYMEKVPIRVIDRNKHQDLKAHDQIVELVDQTLILHQRLISVKNPPEQMALEGQISAIDNQIDRLVYDLYGLTQEEIQIVEAE